MVSRILVHCNNHNKYCYLNPRITAVIRIAPIKPKMTNNIPVLVCPSSNATIPAITTKPDTELPSHFMLINPFLFFNNTFCKTSFHFGCRLQKVFK